MIDRYNSWEVICKCVGQKISYLHRVYNVLHGEIQVENVHPLQVNFANGQILLLDRSSDSEALLAKDTAWQDIFGGRNDKQTRDYIEEYGRWTLIDVSAQDQYRDLTGQSIQSAYPLKARTDKLSGVQFEINGIHFNFIWAWDECFVFWGNESAEFDARWVTVDYALGCTANDSRRQE